MSGPLAGVRVLEAGSFIAGPYAAMLLGQLGADVVKIEPPGAGDPARAWGDGGTSPWFAAHNAAKRSLTLDLRAPGAWEVVGRLVRAADVLVENFRPGVAERLGIGYERLRAVNPRLVYCAISGVGREGPDAAQPGFDTVGQALSGLMSLLSSPEDPAPAGPAVVDTVAGMLAALGVAAALQARSRTGAGQRVDTSLVQAGLGLLPEALALHRQTGAALDRFDRARVAQVYLFRCGDGLPLAVHLSSPPKFWGALVRAAGREDLLADPRYGTRAGRIRHYDGIRGELAPVFAARPRSEWLRRLSEADVPSAPVHTVDQALADPTVGRLLAAPLGFSETALPAPAAAPALGQHTEEILRGAGFDDPGIAGLRAAGII